MIDLHFVDLNTERHEGVKVGQALDAFDGVLTGTPKFKGNIQDLGSRDISEK